MSAQTFRRPAVPLTAAGPPTSTRQAVNTSRAAVVALWAALDGLGEDEVRQVLSGLSPWLPRLDVDRIVADLARDTARARGGLP